MAEISVIQMQPLSCNKEHESFQTKHVAKFRPGENTYSDCGLKEEWRNLRQTGTRRERWRIPPQRRWTTTPSVTISYQSLTVNAILMSTALSHPDSCDPNNTHGVGTTRHMGLQQPCKLTTPQRFGLADTFIQSNSQVRYNTSIKAKSRSSFKSSCQQVTFF